MSCVHFVISTSLYKKLTENEHRMRLCTVRALMLLESNNDIYKSKSLTCTFAWKEIRHYRS